MDRLQFLFEDNINGTFNINHKSLTYLNIDIFYISELMIKDKVFIKFIKSQNKNQPKSVLPFFLTLTEYELKKYKLMFLKIISVYIKTKKCPKDELYKYTNFVTIMLMMLVSYFYLYNNEEELNSISSKIIPYVTIHDINRQSDPNYSTNYEITNCFLNYPLNEIPQDILNKLKNLK